MEEKNENEIVGTMEKVRSSAGSNPTKVRYVASMSVDEWVRQGDVYVIRVPDGHPRKEPLGTRQVALGVGHGSRHVAEGQMVQVFKAIEAKNGEGPIILDHCIVESPERWALTHPQHAHFDLPAGSFLIRHQLDAATRRRVED